MLSFFYPQLICNLVLHFYHSRRVKSVYQIFSYIKYQRILRLNSSISSKTKSKTSSKTKSTVKKPETYPVKVFGSEKKPLINKKVTGGTKIKLPKIKDYTGDGFKYTFKKWKAKISGRKKPKYLKKTTKEFKITAKTVIKAVFTKTKIKTKSDTSSKKSGKTSSSSKTSSATAPTEDNKDEES